MGRVDNDRVYDSAGRLMGRLDPPDERYAALWFFFIVWR